MSSLRGPLGPLIGKAAGGGISPAALFSSNILYIAQLCIGLHLYYSLQVRYFI